MVEPLAALAAVFALCVGVSTYAAVVETAVDERPDRDIAGPALSHVETLLTTRGVADPAAMSDVSNAAPATYRLNATLTAGNRTWNAGPPVAAHGQRAGRRLSVRLGPGRVRAGRLSVVVWQ